jgi:hypothetical protein
MRKILVDGQRLSDAELLQGDRFGHNGVRGQQDIPQAAITESFEHLLDPGVIHILSGEQRIEKTGVNKNHRL